MDRYKGNCKGETQSSLGTHDRRFIPWKVMEDSQKLYLRRDMKQDINEHDEVQVG